MEQLWLTLEKPYSAEVSSFWLGDGPVRRYFWSLLWQWKIHDRFLYQVTPFSCELEIMDRRT